MNIVGTVKATVKTEVHITRIKVRNMRNRRLYAKRDKLEAKYNKINKK